MNIFSIAFKSLRQRWLASFLTGLSVALGVALMVAILVLNTVITKTFQQSGSGYDLIVGPKGSELQLVLSSIYHIEKPIKNLPWRFYTEMKEHPSVEKAIPINLGDATQIGNFPIVGTTPQYFLAEYAPSKKFMVREPGTGLRGTWDAVIGAEVARKNRWDIGSEFQIVHAGEADHVHDEKFTVRGVLAPTGTPNDRAVFVHIDGFYLIAGHEAPWEQLLQREADFYSESTEDLKKKYATEIADLESHDTGSHDHSHDHSHGLFDFQKEVTSIFLVMKGGNDDLERANRTLNLHTSLNRGMQAQAANPVHVMERLMVNLVGNLRTAFLFFTALIIVVSGIGVFVSIYNSMAERRREIAIMRALGARRETVLSIVLCESLLLCVLGGLAGLILGHGLIYAAAPYIQSRSGLLIDPFTFSTTELIVIPALILLSIFAGLLPALSAYKTDVAEQLQG